MRVRVASRRGSRTRTSSSSRATGTRGQVFRAAPRRGRARGAASRRPLPSRPPPTSPLSEKTRAAASALVSSRATGVTYHARVHSLAARPPARHGEGDEGRGLPRGHDRPLRVEEPQPSSRSARARRSASRPTRSRRRSWRSLVEAEKAAETRRAEGEASPAAR